MSEAGSGPLSLQGRGAGQGERCCPQHHLGVLCPALGSAQQQAGGQARRRTLVTGADVPPYRRSVGHVPPCPSERADFCGNRENWDVPGFSCSPQPVARTANSTTPSAAPELDAAPSLRGAEGCEEAARCSALLLCPASSQRLAHLPPSPPATQRASPTPPRPP